MEIWYINSRKSLEIQTSLAFSNELLTVLKSGLKFRHYAADCVPSFNHIMVESYAALSSCTAVVQASDSMTVST